MEYQGIITGIGDKLNGENLIKPEVDAVINKFIVGKNTILEGLELNGNNLSKGVCVLCGYRGIMDENKTLDTTAYVYGKFTLNFNAEIIDTFAIETSDIEITTNVNPNEITQEGTYYLLLYENGELSLRLDTDYSYPVNAQFSYGTNKVLDNAEIESEVIGTTQPINDNSKHIATTEYVHNQIQEEIDYKTETVNVTFACSDSLGENFDKTGNFMLKQKAKYVIVESTAISGFFGEILKPQVIGTISNNFLPKKTIYGVLIGTSSTIVEGVLTPAITSLNGRIEVNTNGQISIVESIYTVGTLSNVKVILGYECQ